MDRSHPDLLYKKGTIVTGELPFDKLREQSLINPVAMAAQDDPKFSARIREGMSSAHQPDEVK